MRKTITLITCVWCILSLSGCASTKTGSMSSSNIQKVNLNDTFMQVVKKVGEPTQVLSKELTEDENEKVIWLYEEKNILGSMMRNFCEGAASNMAPGMARSRSASNNLAYAVTFINGQVAGVQRVQ